MAKFILCDLETKVAKKPDLLLIILATLSRLYLAISKPGIVEKTLIDELESFFSSVELPATIRLGPGEMITNVKRFVDVHLTRIKAYPNLPLYKVYYDHLLKLKKILEDGDTAKK